MVNTIEYLLAAIVLIFIFSAAAVAMVWVLDPIFTDISRRHLLSVGERLLDQFVGYSGDPAQWGSDITLSASSIRGIGLAKASRDYTALLLDTDKVTRLTQSQVGTYVDPAIVRRLSNLQNSYDFNLKFIPVLNISITPTKTITTTKGKVLETAFNIVVKTHEEIRVANVNLSAYILTSYMVKIGGEDYVNYSLLPVTQRVTDWKGETSFDYTQSMSQLINKDLVGAVLVLQGTYYGIRVNAIRQSQSSSDILDATFVGNNIILGIDPELQKGARHLRQELVEGTLNSITTTDFVDVTDNVNAEAPWVINYGSKNFRVYEVDYMEPDIFFLAFVVKWQGKYWLVVAPRLPFGQIGTDMPTGTEVAEMRKIVLIDGMAYYADLHIWRTSFYDKG
jgi:hypothetical protein